MIDEITEWLKHPDNAKIWRRFRRHADRVWDRGFRHYSARTIGEFLRHYSNLSDSGPGYKINDHIWPKLARLYMAENPERQGFFELRNRHDH